MATHLHIAHRGYRTGLGDNTIAQIREAIRLGADMVEVDVRRRASDGELVLAHDKGPNETAPRLRDALALARHAGIPLQFVDADGLVAKKRGVTTHACVTQAFHRSTHTDPGAAFPLDTYLARARVAFAAGERIT